MISHKKDINEPKSQDKKIARKKREEGQAVRREQKKQKTKHKIESRLQEDDNFCDDIVITQNDKQKEEYDKQKEEEGKHDFLKKRNTLDIKGLASTAIRYQSSNREAAALATAFLGDLIKAGFLPPEAASLAVDGSKLQRARKNIMAKAIERGVEKTVHGNIKCIMFDS